MCGIIGGFGSASYNKGDINRALDTIIHRGPDDHGILIRSKSFIAARRLAIIDTVNGNQPLCNENKKIWAAQNGEIYNYRELKLDLINKGHKFQSNCDTEVLVHLYEEYGRTFVNKLRGMFSFVILDTEKNLMYIARDRFGKKPLYYYNYNNIFLFASEIKALKSLISDSKINLTLSDQAIYDYLSLSFIPQPNTIYNEIKTIEPGSYIVIKDERIVHKKYWDLNAKIKYSHDYEEILTDVRKKIQKSVQIRLRSDVPLGVLLSGGIDSTVVTYEAKQIYGDDLKTYTVENEDENLNESEIASRTSDFLGVKNYRLKLYSTPLDDLLKLVEHYDQPYADSSAIPSYGICKLAKQHVTVLLNGDGGDELFGGYRRYYASHKLDNLNFLSLKLLKYFDKIISTKNSNRRNKIGMLKRFAKGANMNPADRYLAWTYDMLNEADKKNVWKKKNMNPTENLINSFFDSGECNVRKMMNCDVNLILLSDLLVKMDMASMAVSVEARSPLLDHEVAEASVNIPSKFLFRNGSTKSVLRDAYKNVIPNEVLNAPKRGFEIPMKKWLNKDFKCLIMDLFSNNNAKVYNYLDKNFVTKLFNGDIMEGKNTTYLKYSILVLELWLKNYSGK